MRLALRRGGRRHHHHRPWYRRITRTQVGLVVGGLLVVAAAVFALQASQANTSLRLAANQAEVLQNQIVSGDQEGAMTTLTSLQQSAARAHAKTKGVLWDVGGKVPWLGRNVDAVQTVAEVVDQISADALPPLVGLSQQVNASTFSPKDGRVDLAALTSVRPSLERASAALTSANDKLAHIDASSLLVPIRGPVGTIQDKIGSAQRAAASSDTAAKLLPAMLGGEGTRRYLLLIQNNAEIRPTGGISGSYAVIKASQGKLSMGQQGSIHDLPPFAHPVVPMTKDEQAVFSPDLVEDLRDINLTPDFPRTGEIAKAMAARGLGVDVDGVISVDPVAMGYLLAGTGPVQLSDGTSIDQSNAVSVLLNGIYRTHPDNDTQDDIFQSAARRIFDLVKAGAGQPRTVISGLVTAADQDRLSVWSAHPDEQKDIASTGLAGAVGGDDGSSPHVGIYLSDAGSDKMSYYLDYTTVVSPGRCLDGGVQEISTTTELVSNAPADAANLGPYVTGTGEFAPKGTMSLILRAYSPYGGAFTSVRVDGKEQTVYADRYLGRNVSRVPVRLAPGQTVTVTTTMISGKDQRGDVVLGTTPGLQTTNNGSSFASKC